MVFFCFFVLVWRKYGCWAVKKQKESRWASKSWTKRYNVEEFDLDSKIQAIKSETSILFISSGSFPPLLLKLPRGSRILLVTVRLPCKLPLVTPKPNFSTSHCSEHRALLSINQHTYKKTHPYTAISSSSSSLSALSLCFPYLLHETLKNSGSWIHGEGQGHLGGRERRRCCDHHIQSPCQRLGHTE